MSMMGIASAAAFALTLAAPAIAAEGRWSSGYNMGMTAATVGNGRATFIVNCVDQNPTAVSGFMLELRRPEPRGMDAAVRTRISVDGRASVFQFTRDRAGNISWDAAPPGARRDMSMLVARMRAGRMLTVAMPSEGVRESFSLRGAGRELRGCPGRR